VAIVNLTALDNGTWQDAFQFGTPTDFTWDLIGQNFIMEIKANRDDTDVLLTLSTDDLTIVVVDAAQRVIALQVPPSVLAAALIPGDYVYDLVMYDNSVPPVRVPLMQGIVCIKHGVTQD